MALACRLLARSHRVLLVPLTAAPRQPTQNIAMSARRLQMDDAVDKLKAKNPYYDKYAAKLDALKQKAPEEFLDRVTQVVQPPKPTKPAEKPRDYSELLNPKADLSKTAAASATTTTKAATAAGQPAIATKPGEIPHKQLADIMKIELLADKTAAEIAHIWLEYHTHKDSCLVATLTGDAYDAQLARGRDHPMFIVPLPRSEGFEFFLFQFAANTVHFTPLLCYQVHKENAPECLNIVYYTELRAERDIVLMRAEYDRNVVNAQEAQCLANQLQLYYARTAPASKLALLEKFTRRPAEFQHTDVIRELENLSIV